MKRTYCYQTQDGEVHEFEFLSGAAPEYVVIDGERAYRDYQSEVCSQHATVKRTSNRVKRTYPFACCASGVHASQAQELRDHLARNGVPTEVTSDGDPVYTSAAHRKKALKVRGMRDKSAFC